MYWQAGHNFTFQELAGRTQVNLLSGPVFNISFIQQRSSGLQAGGLLFGGLILEGREEEGSSIASFLCSDGLSRCPF